MHNDTEIMWMKCQTLFLGAKPQFLRNKLLICRLQIVVCCSLKIKSPKNNTSFMMYKVFIEA